MPRKSLISNFFIATQKLVAKIIPPTDSSSYIRRSPFKVASESDAYAITAVDK